jgi:hypothetical protein
MDNGLTSVALVLSEQIAASDSTNTSAQTGKEDTTLLRSHG